MGDTVCSVFGPRFCSRRTVDLIIFGTGGFYTVNDATTHVVKFRVMKIDPGLRQICDVAGNPIATLRRKVLTAHGRWEVFKGDSKKEGDRVFSVASPSIFKLKLNYHVFLATNQHGDDYEDCDFKVNGNWKKKTISIYDAKSPTNITSQVDQKQKAKNWNELEVKVKVNMDQAFVVAVIMIIDAIYEEEPGAGKSGGAGAAKGAFGALEATANLLEALSSN